MPLTARFSGAQPQKSEGKKGSKKVGEKKNSNGNPSRTRRVKKKPEWDVSYLLCECLPIADAVKLHAVEQ